ncbi:DUF2951 family protein [Kushneria aurantia]|uniref:DUF2951 family protein n=1 Tax=Kushneria aurantia TaxID=504092 RepID=A0ABV6G6Z7_9GAMM|nr:DUF2951 family protein [Kushneria aurantia]
MTLTEEDIAYLKAHLGEWLAEQSLGKPPAVYEVELRERMVRVEEELKHQRELMREGFAQTDRRFEEQRQEMLARFEQVDKRFEQVDKRFEQIDKRFEQIDKRFKQVDDRFDTMMKRHDRQFMWLIGFIATVGGLVVALVKLL